MGANLRQDESRSDWAVDRPASVRLAVIDAPLGRLAPAKSHASASAQRFRNTGAMPPIWCQTTEFNREATILFVDGPIAEPTEAARGDGRDSGAWECAGVKHPRTEVSVMTAEHAAARSPRDRPVILPQPYLPHHALA